MTDSPPRSPAFWAGWICAGVFLVVAAVAGVYAANLRTQLEDVELRLVDAVTKLDLSQERLVGAATESTAIRSNLSILSAPDAQVFRMTGKGTAPGASARAFVSLSKGLLFSASALPKVAEGSAYQLWFLMHGAPVNAGLVHPTDDGNVTAAFDPLTDAPPITGFAVSVEPEAGSTKPTAAFVLSSQ